MNRSELEILKRKEQLATNYSQLANFSTFKRKSSQTASLMRLRLPQMPQFASTQLWESSEVARSPLFSSNPTKRMGKPHLPCSHCDSKSTMDSRIELFAGLIKPRALYKMQRRKSCISRRQTLTSICNSRHRGAQTTV